MELKNKPLKLSLIFVILLIMIPLSMAIAIYPISAEDKVKLISIEELNSISEDNLYSEVLLKANINKSRGVGEDNFKLIFSFPIGKIIYSNIPYSIQICDGASEEFSYGDYSKFDLKCEHELINEAKAPLFLDLNLTRINTTQMIIKITYSLPANTTLHLNNQQYITWLRIYCPSSACPDNEESIVRYLKLPSPNNVIEEKLNFQFENIIDDKIVLKSVGKGDAMVWYKDIYDESKENSRWLRYGVYLSFIAALIIMFLQNISIIKRFKDWQNSVLGLLLFFQFVSLWWFFEEPTIQRAAALSKYMPYLWSLFVIILVTAVIQANIQNNKQCGFCAKKCKSKFGLNRHMKQTHRIISSR